MGSTGASKVKENTRDKIQSIIAARRSYLLEMIYDDANALYIDEVQRGVLSVCRDVGYEPVVHPCDRISDTLTSEAVAFVHRSELAGVIVLPPVSEDLHSHFLNGVDHPRTRPARRSSWTLY